ncbi:glucoamylase [Mycena amicta]|nr:glucoamylase [Mycena amicta]
MWSTAILLAFCLTTFAHAAANPDFYLIDSMLANIGSSGSKAVGVPSGIVIASPSKTNPDYFYTWTRDSSLVFKTIVDQYSGGQSPELQTLIEQFIQAETKLQNVTNPSGNILSGGLGEPKFNADMTAFTGAWGRPQRDGPALRAIAVMLYAGLGNTTASVWPMVKADLDYVMTNWNLSTFDLWEEINSSGSFFTSAVQHRALRQGASLATSLGLTAVASGYTAAADSLLCFLQTYWNPTGYITANKGGGRSGKDANTVLASIHTFDATAGCDALTFQPCSDKALANLKVYVDAFRSVYAINIGAASNAAVATGRYPEDGYMGGNPWYLTTLAVAEQLYRAVAVWNAQGSLTISSISVPFFRQFAPNVAVGTYDADSSVFQSLTEAIATSADGFLSIIDKYTPSSGSLSEQYSRSDGKPLSAADLTWSYAAVLTASDAKGGKILASSSWGGKGLVLSDSCSTGGGNGNGGAGGGGGSGNDIPVHVVFDLTVDISQGEYVFVVGSLPALSQWNPDNAIPLRPINLTTQSVAVDLPANTTVQYKYIRKTTGNSTVRWESDPNRSLTTPGSGSVTLNDKWNSGGVGPGPSRVNVTFHESVSVTSGERVYIAGSLPELKQWNPNDAIALTQVFSGVWIVTIELPANTNNIFYKYMRKAGTRVIWEANPNRQISTGSGGTTENDTWR